MVALRAHLVANIGLLSVFAWSAPGFAQLDEQIEMRPGDYREDNWFLEHYIAQEWEQGYNLPTYVRDRDVLVGRIDLNADGVEEIILQIEGNGYCGSAGCATVVLQRRAESWSIIGGGNLSNWVLTERVCGYRSLLSRAGIHRWNGTRYAYAYASPFDTLTRIVTISGDNLERLNPNNGLIEPGDCPDPEAAAKAPQGHRISTTARVVALYYPGESPQEKPDRVFDLLPGDYGADATFIEAVVVEAFERDPPPDDYSRARNIHIGRIDMNGDGTAELFIANYQRDACQIRGARDGCPFKLYQRSGTDWREIGAGSLRYAVKLMDETVGGYRSIWGLPEYYRWNGERYEAVTQ